MDIKEDIKQVIEVLEFKTQNLRSHRNHIREYLPFIEYDQFKKLLKVHAEWILTKRGRNSEFIIDADNETVIEILYKYLIGKDFEGDLNKGLLIMGNIGTGKTLLLMAYFNIIESHTNRIITKIHSKALAKGIRVNGLEWYEGRPVFIDDIGKETKEVKDYGTIINPVPDIISLRYEYGSWTFATCNYKSDELLSFYGETILDRFKEMFNVLTLTGNSRRK